MFTNMLCHEALLSDENYLKLLLCKCKTNLQTLFYKKWVSFKFASLNNCILNQLSTLITLTFIVLLLCVIVRVMVTENMN